MYNVRCNRTQQKVMFGAYCTFEGHKLNGFEDVKAELFLILFFSYNFLFFTPSLQISVFHL